MGKRTAPTPFLCTKEIGNHLSAYSWVLRSNIKVVMSFIKRMLMKQELSPSGAINKHDEEKSVSTLEDFLNCVEHTNDGAVYLYRGHSRLCYKLTPSVGRDDLSLQNEKQMFLEFKRRYYLYTDHRPKTDMELLFLAQHYGVPTRLLDWSYNPLVALYFACCSDTSYEGTVYVHKISSHHCCVKEGHQLDNDIFSTSFELSHHFMIPDYTDRRFVNQQGMFLWFRDPKEEYKSIHKNIIIKNKVDILQSLHAIGITESFIYPTLDSLGREIKDKYLNNTINSK